MIYNKGCIQNKKVVWKCPASAQRSKQVSAETYKSDLGEKKTSV